jgi:hypothetical protein
VAMCSFFDASLTCKSGHIPLVQTCYRTSCHHSAWPRVCRLPV